MFKEGLARTPTCRFRIKDTLTLSSNCLPQRSLGICIDVFFQMPDRILQTQIHTPTHHTPPQMDVAGHRFVSLFYPSCSQFLCYIGHQWAIAVQETISSLIVYRSEEPWWRQSSRVGRSSNTLSATAFFFCYYLLEGCVKLLAQYFSTSVAARSCPNRPSSNLYDSLGSTASTLAEELMRHTDAKLRGKVSFQGAGLMIDTSSSSSLPFARRRGICRECG